MNLKWLLFLTCALIGCGLFIAPRIIAKSPSSSLSKASLHRVQPRLTNELKQQGLTWGAPVYLRAFKEEKILELWVQETGKKTFKLFRSYPIAAASGKLGPKKKEGDQQVPEGFYSVPAGMMNPHSRFHLAFNIGYPNHYDRGLGRTGSFIMVHGSNVSSGCLAMTDEKIEEIYNLCDAAHRKGQKAFQIHIFPFRMNNELRFKKAHNHQYYDFWQNLRQGYDWFEKHRHPPNVRSAKGKYFFSKK